MTELYGWAGKILRVDLTTGTFSTIDSTKYVPEYVGGYGVALRIWWEEMRPGIKAFDPDNKIILMNGVASGTLSPSSGRCNVLSVSPHSYPEQLTNSSIGGVWPSKLKWSGYDGIVVEGRAPEPCYLLISDGRPQLIPCADLWGLGLIDSQVILRNRHGADTETYGIGPAGENRVRYAIIGSGPHNATGQGGMGAVFGAKNLKAISIIGGKHQVKVHDMEAVIAATKKFHPDKRARPRIEADLSDKANNPHWKEWGAGNPATEGHASDWMGEIHNLPYPFLTKSCTTGCLAACGFFEFKDIPAVTHPGLQLGMTGCVHTRYEQFLDRLPAKDKFAQAFEIHVLAQQLGLGHLELVYGFIPWLFYTKALGIDTEALVGVQTDVRSNTWWIKLLNMITYREGFGDQMAEGLRRTVEALGPEQYWYPIYEGPEAAREGAVKPYKGPVAAIGGWGYASRGIQREMPMFGFLPGALNWMIDTRDSHHNKWPDWINPQFFRYVGMEQDKYGSPFPIKWAKDSTMRGVLIDCLPACFMFPLRLLMGWTYQFEVGEGTESTGFESMLFSAVTGVETTEQEYYKAGERINTLTRAILLRDFERTAEMEQAEIVKTFVGVLDPEKFKLTAGNFYEALGWDRNTGYPTQAHLEELGLEDVCAELAKIGKLGQPTVAVS